MNELGLTINHSMLELDMRNSVGWQCFRLLLVYVDMKRKICVCLTNMYSTSLRLSLDKKGERVISSIPYSLIRLSVARVVDTEK